MNYLELRYFPFYRDLEQKRFLLDFTLIVEIKRSLSYGDSSGKFGNYGVRSPEALYCRFERRIGEK